MLKQKIMDQINEHVGSIVKSNPLVDIEKNLKAIIVAVLNKLDLVTREEFDTQQKVLLATRKKIDELERKIDQLSEAIKK